MRMKKRENLKVVDHKIVEKEFTGTKHGGVDHYNWKTIATLESEEMAMICMRAISC